jgi:hypothetical protein
MALGNNRDYVKTARIAEQSLAKHAARMAALIAGGMSKEDASKQAYDEIVASGRAKTVARIEREIKKRERMIVMGIYDCCTTNEVEAREEIARLNRWKERNGGKV